MSSKTNGQRQRKNRPAPARKPATLARADKRSRTASGLAALIALSWVVGGVIAPSMAAEESLAGSPVNLSGDYGIDLAKGLNPDQIYAYIHDTQSTRVNANTVSSSSLYDNSYPWSSGNIGSQTLYTTPGSNLALLYQGSATTAKVLIRDTANSVNAAATCWLPAHLVPQSAPSSQTSDPGEAGDRADSAPASSPATSPVAASTAASGQVGSAGSPLSSLTVPFPILPLTTADSASDGEAADSGAGEVAAPAGTQSETAEDSAPSEAQEPAAPVAPAESAGEGTDNPAPADVNEGGLEDGLGSDEAPVESEAPAPAPAVEEEIVTLGQYEVSKDTSWENTLTKLQGENWQVVPGSLVAQNSALLPAACEGNPVKTYTFQSKGTWSENTPGDPRASGISKAPVSVYNTDQVTLGGETRSVLVVSSDSHVATYSSNHKLNLTKRPRVMDNNYNAQPADDETMATLEAAVRRYAQGSSGLSPEELQVQLFSILNKKLYVRYVGTSASPLDVKQTRSKLASTLDYYRNNPDNWLTNEKYLAGLRLVRDTSKPALLQADGSVRYPFKLIGYLPNREKTGSTDTITIAAGPTDAPLQTTATFAEAASGFYAAVPQCAADSEATTTSIQVSGKISVSGAQFKDSSYRDDRAALKMAAATLPLPFTLSYDQLPCFRPQVPPATIKTYAGHIPSGDSAQLGAAEVLASPNRAIINDGRSKFVFDRVTYENLQPNTTYTLQARLKAQVRDGGADVDLPDWGVAGVKTVTVVSDEDGKGTWLPSATGISTTVPAAQLANYQSLYFEESLLDAAGKVLATHAVNPSASDLQTLTITDQPSMQVQVWNDSTERVVPTNQWADLQKYELRLIMNCVAPGNQPYTFYGTVAASTGSAYFFGPGVVAKDGATDTVKVPVGSICRITQELPNDFFSSFTSVNYLKGSDGLFHGIEPDAATRQILSRTSQYIDSTGQAFTDTVTAFVGPAFTAVADNAHATVAGAPTVEVRLSDAFQAYGTLTVRNEMAPLQGQVPSELSQEPYHYAVRCTDGKSADFDLVPGASQTVDGLAPGVKCNVYQQKKTSYGQNAYTSTHQGWKDGAGQSLTSTPDGYGDYTTVAFSSSNLHPTVVAQNVPVDMRRTVNVRVENILPPADAGVVSSTDLAAQPYQINYTCGTQSGILTLTGAETATIPAVAPGTECTLTQQSPTLHENLAGKISWEKAGGQVENGGSTRNQSTTPTVTFTFKDGDTVVLTNTYRALKGRFVIVKRVVDNGRILAAGSKFPFTVTCTDAQGHSLDSGAAPNLGKDETWPSPLLPTGSTCQVAEVSTFVKGGKVARAFAAASTPTSAQGALTTSATGATITIGQATGEEVKLQVTNTITPVTTDLEVKVNYPAGFSQSEDEPFKDKEYSFTVACNDPVSDPDNYADVHQVRATVSTPALITGLKPGTTCKVTPDPAPVDGYDLTSVWKGTKNGAPATSSEETYTLTTTKQGPSGDLEGEKVTSVTRENTYRPQLSTLRLTLGSVNSISGVATSTVADYPEREYTFRYQCDAALPQAPASGTFTLQPNNQAQVQVRTGAQCWVWQEDPLLERDKDLGISLTSTLGGVNHTSGAELNSQGVTLGENGPVAKEDSNIPALHFSVPANPTDPSVDPVAIDIQAENTFTAPRLGVVLKSVLTGDALDAFTRNYRALLGIRCVGRGGQTIEKQIAFTHALPLASPSTVSAEFTDDDLAPGSTCKVYDLIRPATPANVSTGADTWQLGGQELSAGSEKWNNFNTAEVPVASFELVKDQTAVVSVERPYRYQRGNLTVQTEVNVPADQADFVKPNPQAPYRVDLVCTVGGSEVTLLKGKEVTAGGSLSLADVTVTEADVAAGVSPRASELVAGGLPAGTSCRLSVDSPQLPAGFTSTPSFSGEGLTPSGSTATFTIQGGSDPASPADNTVTFSTQLTRNFGAFTLTKAVEKVGTQDLISPRGPYTFHYTCTDAAAASAEGRYLSAGKEVTGDIELQGNGDSATEENIPQGYACTLTEDEPAQVPGATVSAIDPLSFEITSSQTPLALTATNTYSGTTGSFTLTNLEEVTGGFASQAPEKYSYTWACYVRDPRQNPGEKPIRSGPLDFSPRLEGGQEVRDQQGNRLFAAQTVSDLPTGAYCQVTGQEADQAVVEGMRPRVDWEVTPTRLQGESATDTYTSPVFTIGTPTERTEVDVTNSFEREMVELYLSNNLSTDVSHPALTPARLYSFEYRCYTAATEQTTGFTRVALAADGSELRLTDAAGQPLQVPYNSTCELRELAGATAVAGVHSALQEGFELTTSLRSFVRSPEGLVSTQLAAQTTAGVSGQDTVITFPARSAGGVVIAAQNDYLAAPTLTSVLADQNGSQNILIDEAQASLTLVDILHFERLRAGKYRVHSYLVDRQSLAATGIEKVSDFTVVAGGENDDWPIELVVSGAQVRQHPAGFTAGAYLTRLETNAEGQEVASEWTLRHEPGTKGWTEASAQAQSVTVGLHPVLSTSAYLAPVPSTEAETGAEETAAADTAAADPAAGTELVRELPENQAATILDRVSYRHLTPGTYTLYGQVVRVENGQAQEVLDTSSQSVTVAAQSATNADFAPVMSFSLNAEQVGGKDRTFVVQEYLFAANTQVTAENLAQLLESGQALARHAALSGPAAQPQSVHTVYVPPVYHPQIDTVASAADAQNQPLGTHGLTPAHGAKAVDTVTLTDLDPAGHYLLVGEVVDRADLANGDTYQVKAQAQAEVYPDGQGQAQVLMPFSFDALEGHSYVIFQRLYEIGTEAGQVRYSGGQADMTGAKAVATHDDAADLDQVLDAVKLTATRARVAGGEGKGKYLDAAALAAGFTVSDEVDYRGLNPERTYTLSATLAVRDAQGQVTLSDITSQPLTLGAGGQALAENSEDMQVEVNLSVSAADASRLGLLDENGASTGATLVVYEYLRDENGKVVAFHTDPRSAEQSIYTPALSTFATDGGEKGDADQFFKPGQLDAVIADQVTLVGALPANSAFTLVTQVVKVGQEAAGPVVPAQATPVRTDSEGHLPSGLSVEVEMPAELLTAGSQYQVWQLLYAGTQVGAAAQPVVVHHEATGQVVTVKEREKLQPNVTLSTFATVGQAEVGADNALSGNKVADSGEAQAIEIVDTVDYTGLPEGTYTLQATLVDGSGKVVSGVERAQTAINVPVEGIDPVLHSGRTEVTFQVPAEVVSRYAGQRLAVYEDLYVGDLRQAQASAGDTQSGDTQASATPTKIGDHRDANDLGQSIYLAQLSTQVADAADGDQVIAASGEVKLIDRVSAQGLPQLAAGQAYLLVGSLVKVNDPSQILAATARRVAVDEQGAGQWDLPLTLSQAQNVAGEKLVVFESLVRLEEGQVPAGADSEAGAQLSFSEGQVALPAGATVVAAHAKADARTQQVRSYVLKTQASGDYYGDIEAERGGKITDVVSYSDLTPGVEYTLETSLHLRNVTAASDAGEAGVTDGGAVSGIVGSEKFTPQAASGKHPVTLKVPARALQAGTTVVVYQRLKQGEAVIAEHADITAQAQAVAVVGTPRLSATALSEDGQRGFSTADQEATYSVSPQVTRLIDRVQWENLPARDAAGKELVYVLRGHLSEVSGDSAQELRGTQNTRAFRLSQVSGQEISLSLPVPAGTLQPGAGILATEELFVADGDLVSVDPTSGLVSIKNNAPVIASHGQVGQNGQMVQVEYAPQLTQTTLSGAQGAKEIVVGASPVTLTDQVSFSGLKPNTDYFLIGRLYGGDGQTLEENSDRLALSDTQVAQVVAFRTKSAAPGESGATGSVEIEFTVSPQLQAQYAKLVAYEYLYEGTPANADDATASAAAAGAALDDHADPNSESQTVSLQTPTLTTVALADTNRRTITVKEGREQSNGKVVITDQVTYTGLLPAQRYALEGTLMSAKTGLPLGATDAGEAGVAGGGEAPYRRQVVFTSTQTGSGQVPVTFTIPAAQVSALLGADESVVVFEKLWLPASFTEGADGSFTANGPADLSHASLDFESQTLPVTRARFGDFLIRPQLIKNIDDPLNDPQQATYTFTWVCNDPAAPEATSALSGSIDLGLEGNTAGLPTSHRVTGIPDGYQCDLREDTDALTRTTSGKVQVTWAQDGTRLLEGSPLEGQDSNQRLVFTVGGASNTFSWDITARNALSKAPALTTQTSGDQVVNYGQAFSDQVSYTNLPDGHYWLHSYLVKKVGEEEFSSLADSADSVWTPLVISDGASRGTLPVSLKAGAQLGEDDQLIVWQDLYDQAQVLVSGDAESGWQVQAQDDATLVAFHHETTTPGEADSRQGITLRNNFGSLRIQKVVKFGEDDPDFVPREGVELTSPEQMLERFAGSGHDYSFAYSCVVPVEMRQYLAGRLSGQVNLTGSLSAQAAVSDAGIAGQGSAAVEAIPPQSTCTITEAELQVPAGWQATTTWNTRAGEAGADFSNGKENTGDSSTEVTFQDFSDYTLVSTTVLRRVALPAPTEVEPPAGPQTEEATPGTPREGNANNTVPLPGVTLPARPAAVPTQVRVTVAPSDPPVSPAVTLPADTPQEIPEVILPPVAPAITAPATPAEGAKLPPALAHTGAQAAVLGGLAGALFALGALGGIVARRLSRREED